MLYIIRIGQKNNFLSFVCIYVCFQYMQYSYTLSLLSRSLASISALKSFHPTLNNVLSSALLFDFDMESMRIFSPYSLHSSRISCLRFTLSFSFPPSLYRRWQDRRRQDRSADDRAFDRTGQITVKAGQAKYVGRTWSSFVHCNSESWWGGAGGLVFPCQ